MRTMTRIGLAVMIVVAAVTAVIVPATAASAAPGWEAPVHASIWQTFRPAANPTHDGVDLGAERNVPIKAASAGRVVVRECNAHIGSTPYSCDEDGSPTVKGCGWYVDIAHPDNVITRYCHMVSAPLVQLGDTVSTGQVIGYVGTSGNSSAPHLHLEVHVIPAGEILDAEPENAVDPVPFFAARGITLGTGNDSPATPTTTTPSTPSTTPPTPVPPDPVVDLDGDGASELVVWRPGETGEFYLRKLGGSAQAPIPLGISGDVPVVGDYDGDGLDDVAVWRRSDGRWLVQTSSGTAVADPKLGTGDDFPAPADYDGDGRMDFAVYQPFAAQFLVLYGTEAAPFSVGLSGDLPVVADYDGDGRADFALWRADGQWIVRTSSGFAVPSVVLGQVDDIPVPGDYDGDGRADFAVWRPSTATWYVRYSTARSAAEAQPPVTFGRAGDIPVVGDYDGDGADDLALWRPSDGTWLIRLSGGVPTVPAGTTPPYTVDASGLITLVHGTVGDVPANEPQWLDEDGTPLTLADLLERRMRSGATAG